MVNVANSLTEVINFKQLVDNFRISFCPDTGVIKQDIHLYQLFIPMFFNCFTIQMNDDNANIYRGNTYQGQASINRVITFTATGVSG